MCTQSTIYNKLTGSIYIYNDKDVNESEIKKKKTTTLSTAVFLHGYKIDHNITPQREKQYTCIYANNTNTEYSTGWG